MKLVIEQSHDHLQCLDQVRKIHGNDCMIVHSFKQPDSYCIIVAVESADVKTGVQLVSSVVSATAPQVFPAASDGGSCNPEFPTASLTTLTGNDTREHTTAEISPAILELARKLGALSEEIKGAKEHSAEVSQKEFEALSFSDVLNGVVGQSPSIPNIEAPVAIKELSADIAKQLTNEPFFDGSEKQKSHTSLPISESAMLFSSIMSQCINMDSDVSLAPSAR